MRWVLKCYKKTEQGYDVVYLNGFKTKTSASELGLKLLKTKEFNIIFIHDLSTEISKELTA